MERLYYNGTVLTMTEPARAEAVLTEDGRIKAVGSKEQLLSAFPGAARVDLQGCTLMPAFIDAHSHLSSYAASFLQAPLEECADFDEIAARIRSFMKENAVKPGAWVIAKGYDHNALAEKKHPPLALLDACAPQNPLILQHASGHVGVFNTPALRELGVTAKTVPPEGGRIGVSGGELTGYMEENAFFTYLKKAPAAGADALLAAYLEAQKRYAAYGITTIQEGMTVGEMIPLYQALLSRNLLMLDTVGYAALPDAERVFAAFPDAVKRYDRHFKLGGCKIFLDGSPQGRTAWMRAPYLGGDGSDCGYGTMKDAEVLSALETAAAEHMQILAHCNGDAAAAQYLHCAKQAEKGFDLAALRPVMIHAQLLGRDQLPDMKRLGITPSFFVAHVYHWGDTHIRNFGMERAASISPAASALRAGIRFTFHQDTPVIEPNMMETVWCAVNRMTKAGTVLGAQERIPVLEALKAVTINAAWQYFEEDAKGSIEPGKNADFAILDKNPLTVPPEELRDIRVQKTVKSDRLIYGRD